MRLWCSHQLPRIVGAAQHSAGTLWSSTMNRHCALPTSVIGIATTLVCPEASSDGEQSSAVRWASCLCASAAVLGFACVRFMQINGTLNGLLLNTYAGTDGRLLAA